MAPAKVKLVNSANQKIECAPDLTTSSANVDGLITYNGVSCGTSGLNPAIPSIASQWKMVITNFTSGLVGNSADFTIAGCTGTQCGGCVATNPPPTRCLNEGYRDSCNNPQIGTKDCSCYNTERTKKLDNGLSCYVPNNPLTPCNNRTERVTTIKTCNKVNNEGKMEITNENNCGNSGFSSCSIYGL